MIASLKAGLLTASMLSAFIHFSFSCSQEGGLWNFLFQDSVRKDPEHDTPGWRCWWPLPTIRTCWINKLYIEFALVFALKNHIMLARIGIRRMSSPRKASWPLRPGSKLSSNVTIEIEEIFGMDFITFLYFVVLKSTDFQGSNSCI